jgi:hypothetical protein
MYILNVLETRWLHLEHIATLQFDNPRVRTNGRSSERESVRETDRHFRTSLSLMGQVGLMNNLCHRLSSLKPREAPQTKCVSS